MNENIKNMLWVEKYRPKNINDCILPKHLKKLFKEYVNKGEIPNLLLYGRAGVGKTTVAKALCDEIGLDYLFINGSDESGIDTFRNKIKTYASSLSISGGKKVIIIDEADYLNCFGENETVRVGTVNNYTDVPLKDLKVGREYPIVSFNMKTGELENDIGHIVSDIEKELCEIELEDGTKMLVTEDHPFIVEDYGEYVEKSIANGLSYVLVNGENLNIVGVSEHGIGRAINLEVEKNHTFIVGKGVVVHNCNSTQPALRSAMEEFSSNCTFIFTCNNKTRIIEPLHSRCAVIDFDVPTKEFSDIAMEFFNRTKKILSNEQIEYDEKVLVTIIKKFFPDFRRVLNELQRYSQFGKIDSGLLSAIGNRNIEELIDFIRDKNFGNIRKWVATNDVSTEIFRELYDNLYEYLELSSIPKAVVIINEYQYKHAFVSDVEINLVACITEILLYCDVK